MKASGTGNIILIGMPGCGKTCVGRELARISRRPFFDIDDLVREMAGLSIPEIFAREGEAAFRALERQVTINVTQNSGGIIATGGGTVLLAENRRALSRSGRVYFLMRDLALLPSAGRPLSCDLPALYAARLPIYRAMANATIFNDNTIAQAAKLIFSEYQNTCTH